jgi:hypothetical protein
MKNKTLILSGLIGLCVMLFSGCMASDTIRAASTKLEVTNPAGKSVSFTFPKELDAKGFDLHVDPVTGAINLKSEAITTSSTGVIDSAGRAQAQAMSDMAKALNSVVSKVLPFVAPQAAPLLKAAPQEVPATEPENESTK